MAQRYIYLPDELNERLKQEENVSALIQKLLREYFNSDLSNKEDLLKQK